ncbi:hypothetical protein ACLUYJ_20645, partial [Acinetobacter baumannii]|uniref:hypothetical protein n=1 Tax=Acinetobacter baumannii TaxID=470 RepID=UPI003994023D
GISQHFDHTTAADLDLVSRVGPGAERVTHLVIVDVDYIVQALAILPQARVGGLIALIVGWLTVGNEVSQVLRTFVAGGHGAVEEVGRGLE